jgi:hypothetical protein
VVVITISAGPLIPTSHAAPESPRTGPTPAPSDRGTPAKDMRPDNSWMVSSLRDAPVSVFGGSDTRPLRSESTPSAHQGALGVPAASKYPPAKPQALPGDTYSAYALVLLTARPPCVEDRPRASLGNPR